MKLGIQTVGFINKRPCEEELQTECLRRANELRKNEEVKAVVTAKVVYLPRRDRSDSSGTSPTRATLYAMQHDSETDS
jgi:hypothetical protein